MSAVYDKRVGGWLWIGVIMVFLQVIIGGITRLTGSGLSITEWNVIMGTLPPMNEAHWEELFDKYKLFPQYKLMNPDMDLHGFKTIFWWEYIHRLWARTFAIVFLLPYLYFVIKGIISRKMAVQLFLLFVFGALQGLVGWVMVQSGLVDQPWVSPLKLSLHLILAFLLFAFLLRITADYSIDKTGFMVTPKMSRQLGGLILLLFVQIFFGGLMAGHKAALFYPTWPKIGDEWIPSTMLTFEPAWVNVLENKAMIHFIHRGLAYVIVLLTLSWWFVNRHKKGSGMFNMLMSSLPGVVLLQAVLGVLTVIYSQGSIPIIIAVLHQAVALILLSILLLLQSAYYKRFIWSKSNEILIATTNTTD